MDQRFSAATVLPSPLYVFVHAGLEADPLLGQLRVIGVRMRV
jgi:hypothetical protein